MSFKAFRILFIILNIKVVFLMENCVQLNWSHKFKYNFFPNNRTSLESKVLNLTKHCLQSLSASNTCKTPAVNVTFPLISKNPNITFEMLHRPVLATKEASTYIAGEVLDAFEKIWKLFVLCLMAAILSGILIWFFDHKANSGHFPHSFWSGVREGLWWAIVTMTTVGYGDKTPKSSLGRAYATLWMIIGMFLLSTFTAQISSSITADGLSPLNEIFGSKIGVPLGSRNFFMRYCYGAKSVKEFTTERELLDSLQKGTVDKIWMFDCKAKGDYNFMIVDVLEDYSWPPEIGVGVQLTNKSNTNEAVTECLHGRRLTVKDKTTRSSAIDIKSGSQLANTGNWNTGTQEFGQSDYRSNEFNEPDVNCFKKYRRGKQRQHIMPASSEKHLTAMDYTLLACGALIIILLTMGTLWSISVRVRNMEKTSDGNIDIEKGVWDIELGVKISNEMETKELAPISSST